LVFLRPETLTIKAHSEKTLTIFCFEGETIKCRFNPIGEKIYLYEVKDGNGNPIYFDDSTRFPDIYAYHNIVYTFSFMNDSDDDSIVTISYGFGDGSNTGFFSMTNNQKIVVIITLISICILIGIGVWWQSKQTYDEYEMTVYDFDEKGEKKRKPIKLKL
jgi:hypothetical protein